MNYHISYKDGVYQAIIVEAPSAEVAEHYFMSQMPDARICGTHKASIDDMKPGKPVRNGKLLLFHLRRSNKRNP